MHTYTAIYYWPQAAWTLVAFYFLPTLPSSLLNFHTINADIWCRPLETMVWLPIFNLHNMRMLNTRCELMIFIGTVTLLWVKFGRSVHECLVATVHTLVVAEKNVIHCNTLMCILFTLHDWYFYWCTHENGQSLSWREPIDHTSMWGLQRLTWVGTNFKRHYTIFLLHFNLSDQNSFYVLVMQSRFHWKHSDQGVQSVRHVPHCVCEHTVVQPQATPQLPAAQQPALSHKS